MSKFAEQTAVQDTRGEASFGEQERSMTVASARVERWSVAGQRTLGAFTRRFSYVGAVLCTVMLVPLVGDTWPSLTVLFACCVASLALIRAYGREWTIEVGLDGLRVTPGFGEAVVAWRTVDGVSLEAASAQQRASGVLAEYLNVTVSWGSQQQASLFAWATDADSLRRLRDDVASRAARAKSSLEHDAVAKVGRASRPVAAWVQALRSTQGAPFRTDAIDLGALRVAVESGALSGLQLVECATALAALGGPSDRAWIASIATKVLDERARRAITALAAGRFDHRSIDDATR